MSKSIVIIQIILFALDAYVEASKEFAACMALRLFDLEFTSAHKALREYQRTIDPWQSSLEGNYL